MSYREVAGAEIVACRDDRCDGRGFLARILDCFQRFDHRAPGRQGFQQQIRVADHAGQHIVQIVGQSAGKTIAWARPPCKMASRARKPPWGSITP